jgi:hypothetical protein
MKTRRRATAHRAAFGVVCDRGASKHRKTRRFTWPGEARNARQTSPTRSTTASFRLSRSRIRSIVNAIRSLYRCAQDQMTSHNPRPARSLPPRTRPEEGRRELTLGFRSLRRSPEHPAPLYTGQTAPNARLKTGGPRRGVCIHSVRASAAVLSELEAVDGVPGAILHWWRGTTSETRRALELGCFFSLNGAEAARPRVIADPLPDRVFTETDFPHTGRSDNSADRPGGVRTIERALVEAWGRNDDEVRRQVWKNLADICAATRTSNLMPRRLQKGACSPRANSRSVAAAMWARTLDVV